VYRGGTFSKSAFYQHCAMLLLLLLVLVLVLVLVG
jgi:hypothetical protein